MKRGLDASLLGERGQHDVACAPPVTCNCRSPASVATAAADRGPLAGLGALMPGVVGLSSRLVGLGEEPHLRSKKLVGSVLVYEDDARRHSGVRPELASIYRRWPAWTG